MKRCVCFILVIMTCGGICLSASDLTLALKSPKETYLLGEPIALTCRLTNTGTSPIKIWINPKEDEIRAIPIDEIKLKVFDVTSGNDFTTPCYIPTPLIVRKKGICTPSTKELLPGQSMERIIEDIHFLACPLEKVPSHTYKFTAILSTEGFTFTKDVWQGTITSNEVIISLEQPQGEDKTYIEDLKAYIEAGKIALKHPPLKTNPLRYYEVASIHAPGLINNHPTSTYAAYAWFGIPNSPIISMSSQEFLDNVHKAGFLTGTFKTDEYGETIPNGKGSYIWLYPEDIQKGIVEMGTLILANHPDFVYRDELRMRIAQAYIYLKQYDNAVKELKLLVNGPNNKFAEKSNEYINLMKQKDWLKE